MSKLTKTIKLGLSKQGSKILIGASIITAGTAVILAVKSTPKYQLLLNEISEERVDAGEGSSLRKRDKIKPLMKAYWPSIVLLVLSGACSVCSHLIDEKHKAALAMALTASNTALSELQLKTIEKIGDKKFTEIKDSINKDKIDKKKPTPESVIVTPSNGKVLMFDSFSGRYFESDVESVKRAVNKLNRQINDERYVTVNELYLELGLPTIELGDMMGWHIDYNNEFEEVIGAQVTDDGRPCIVVSYHPAPSPEGFFLDSY